MLFGGVSIFGGRGSIFGVVIAATVLGVIQQALTLRNVDAQVRNIVTGVLLLVSVVLPNIVATFRRIRVQARNRRRPPPADLPTDPNPSTNKG